MILYSSGSNITKTDYGSTTNCTGKFYNTKSYSSGKCIKYTSMNRVTKYTAFEDAPVLLPAPTQAVTLIPTSTVSIVPTPTQLAGPTPAPNQVVTPTPAPLAPVIIAQATTLSNSSPSKACFAGSERVRLESGRSKFLSDVCVGDRVLVADAAGKTSFSEVSRESSTDTSSV